MSDATASIRIRNLEARFSRHDQPILRIPTVSFERGRTVGVLGPNHSGKSTFLRIVAGLHRKILMGSEASVSYFGETLPNYDRAKISYLSQRFRDTLFPWLTIGENIRLRLRAARHAKGEVEEAVLYLCNALNFPSESDLFDYFGFRESGVEKHVFQLSGGQQQITTLLRSLLPTPEVLLLDEPFSAIDVYKGQVLRETLLRYFELRGITTLFITHSLEEAVDLSDEIIAFQSDRNKPSIKATYSVGRPTPGANLSPAEAAELIERIRSENEMG